MAIDQPIASDLACPACGYDLSGTRDALGAHCPECGGVFTLHDIQRRARCLVRRRERWVLLTLLLPIPAGILGGAIGMGVSRHVQATAVAALISAVLGAYLLSVVSLARDDDVPLPWLTALPMALLVVVLNGIIALLLVMVLCMGFVFAGV